MRDLCQSPPSPAGALQIPPPLATALKNPSPACGGGEGGGTRSLRGRLASDANPGFPLLGPPPQAGEETAGIERADERKAQPLHAGLLAGALILELATAPSHAAERMRFWNLTTVTISQLY